MEKSCSLLDINQGQFDTFDFILLTELEKDASISVTDLAKTIRRSKQFVSYRLSRMEEKGLILGYTAIVDMVKLGYFTFRIYIDFQYMDSKSRAHFVKEMQGQRKVVQVYDVGGKWDLALFVVTKSLRHFRLFWDDILFKYKGKIKEHGIHVYAPIYNFNKKFLASSTVRLVRKVGEGELDSLNDKQKQLLLSYASNVRKPLLTLAKECGYSFVTARKEIKGFIDKGFIVGHNIDIDPSVLGITFYQVVLALDSIHIKDDLFSFCKRQPEIYQVNRIIGGNDFEIKVMVDSEEKLVELIDRLKKKFAAIRDDEYFSFMPVYSRGIVPY